MRRERGMTLHGVIGVVIGFAAIIGVVAWLVPAHYKALREPDDPGWTMMPGGLRWCEVPGGRVYLHERVNSAGGSLSESMVFVPAVLWEPVVPSAEGGK